MLKVELSGKIICQEVPMKGSRFTDTQIFAILEEAESDSLGKEVCRKHGISDATYYNLATKTPLDISYICALHLSRSNQ
jgi:hypothetical protein